MYKEKKETVQGALREVAIVAVRLIIGFMVVNTLAALIINIFTLGY